MRRHSPEDKATGELVNFINSGGLSRHPIFTTPEPPKTNEEAKPAQPTAADDTNVPSFTTRQSSIQNLEQVMGEVQKSWEHKPLAELRAMTKEENQKLVKILLGRTYHLPEPKDLTLKTR